MTVSTTQTAASFIGDGHNTTFTFSFPGVSSSDIVVTLTDVNGVTTTLVQGPGSTQYTLVLNAPIVPNPTGIGGTVTYPNAPGTPIPSTSTLTIARVLPNVQATSLVNQGTLWQPVIEGALDYLTMLAQQSGDLANSAIVAPPSDPQGLNYQLPSVAARANQAITFDASGNVAVGAIPTSGVISTAMAPVVGAATLPAARTAMGLKALATEGFGLGLQDDGAGNARVNTGMVGDSVNQSVTAAFHGTRRVVVTTSGLIYTLPVASTLFNGFNFTIFAVGGPAVVQLSGASDTIDGGALGTLFTISQGAKANIACDGGTGYYVVYNSSVVKAPQGYLSVAAGTIMPTSDTVSGAIYYVGDKGNTIPVWNGAEFMVLPFPDSGPLSVSTTLDGIHHPNGAVFDLFVAVATNPFLVTGPAWVSGAQAPTGGLVRLNGILVNATQFTGINSGNSFTIPANQGTYLGTIFVSPAGQVTCDYSYGQNRIYGLWNYYNRRKLILRTGDPAGSWVDNGAAWAVHNAGNICSMVIGAREEQVRVRLTQRVSAAGPASTLLSVTSTPQIGIGVNGTTGPSGTVGQLSGQLNISGATVGITTGGQIIADFTGFLFGLNTFSALENGGGATGTTSTFSGTESFHLLTVEWFG